MRAGQTVPIPAFLAEGSFDIDLDRKYKLVGCIAVLMEEDATPQSSIVLGRIAYAKEIDKQLNELVAKRIQAQDAGPLTDAELNEIRAAVKAKVESAVESNQPICAFFRDQDDNVGFAFVSYSDAALQVLASSPSRIQAMDFGEISNVFRTSRFALSGTVSITQNPEEPEVIDLCAGVRAAVNAKKQELHGLQSRQDHLQVELQHAAPGHKGVIAAEIEYTNQQIAWVGRELAPLQAELDACTTRHGADSSRVGGSGVVRDEAR